MTEAGPERRTNPWLALVLLLAVSIFNYTDRYLISGLVGPIKQAFAVDDAYMGLLMGPAFVVLYVVAGVPIARLADQRSRVFIIGAGCVLWSACTFASAFATGPVTLALARVGVGIGEAAFSAPAYSLIADYFRPERRGIAFAVLGLATYIGQIGGQAIGPAIARTSDWRYAFEVIGLAGLVMGVLLVLLVREPRRTKPGAVEQIAFAEMLARLRRAPSYVLMMLAFSLGTLSGVAFGQWGPELFARHYGVPPVEAKSAFALYFAIAGITGMLLFGILMDRATRRGPEWPVKMSAMALFAATLCILAVTWVPSFTAAKLLAIPSGLLGGGWAIGFLAATQYILPDRFRTAATATFIMVTTLLGYLIGPWLAGAVSSALGDDARSLQIGLTVVIPFGFVAAILAGLAVRRVEADRVALAS